MFPMLTSGPFYTDVLPFCFCRTHLSWSVCPCPSPRGWAWHVSVLVKTTVERKATSPCNCPTHLDLWQCSSHIQIREEEGERLWGSAGISGPCFLHWDCVLLFSSRHIHMRTRNREQQWKDWKKEKWTSVKCPVLTFLWNKNLSFFSFLFYFQLQSVSFFLWCVCIWPFVC